MSMNVLKFGSSALSDGAHFRQAAEIIRSDAANRYVVVSAPGRRAPEEPSVTELLGRCAQQAKENQDFSATLEQVRSRYEEILRELKLDFPLAEELETIRQELGKGRDCHYAASRGAYLSARILSQYLDIPFVDAGQAIFFRESGAVDLRETYQSLARSLSGVERAILPGSYGLLPDGTIRMFGKGGSDISGSIVARAVGASLYEAWTNGSGLLMADPEIVEQPQVIPALTYRELRDLSYMGVAVLLDEAIAPVREACIPIHIRNINDPDAPGTRIEQSLDGQTPDTVITGVAGRTGYSVITIEKSRMNSIVGFGHRVLAALEAFHINFEHAPTGIDSMSLIVSTDSIADCRRALTARIFQDSGADAVTIEDGLALISVVGRGMVHAKGVLARILGAVVREDVSIHMLNQSACETDVILGLRAEDCHKAIRGIYHEFVRS